MKRFPSAEKLKKLGLYKEIKIRCRYCDIKDDCPLRERKEAYENAGFVTKCIYTPNRPGKKKNKKK